MPLPPTPTPPPSDGTADPASRYRIEQRLGAGATGVVHVALDTHLGRRVALKTLDARLAGSDRFLARFHREADLLARLDSAHIVQVYDHGERDGVPWIATQLVAGGDLGRLLATRGPLPPQLAAQVCAQVADALAVAHDAGIVHGDVKPGNVLVHDPDAQLHVYLCDFGVATELAGEGPDAPPTVVGGTHAYLAPERGRGDQPSVATDVYAAGCLLWACLTGDPPYVGTDVAVILAHAEQPPPQLPGSDPTSVALNGVLARALAKDPAARHPDARALADDLRRAQAGGSAPALPAGPPRGRGRRRAPVAIAAAVVVSLVAAGGVWAIAGAGGDDPSDDTADGNPAETTDAPAPSGTTTSDEPTEQPTSVRTGPPRGDLDGDGLADLAVTHQYASEPATRLLSSDGTSFEEPQDFVSGADLVVTGDVDGDDISDIVAVADLSAEQFRVSIVFGGGGRDDVNVDIAAPPGADSLYPMIGDFDGDGLADLGLPSDPTDESGQRIWVAPSDGTAFGELVEWYAADHPPDEVVPGDFDGDGRVDVLVNDLPDQTFRLLRSTGTSFEPAGPGPDGLQRVSDQVKTPGVGDVDGDGADELVQVGGVDNDLLVVWDLEGEELVDAVWIQLENADRMEQLQRAAPIVVDLDGDGFDDVVRMLGRSDEPPQQLVGYRSTGEAFEEPTEWSDYDCGCDGFAVPVGTMRTA